MGAFGLAVIQKPLLEERGTACGGVVVRDTERLGTVSYE